MPNIMIEGVLSGGVTFGLYKLLETQGMTGKGFKILSMIAGLIVFVMMPWYFNDVQNTGDKVFDDAAETLSDAASSVVRYIIAFITFVAAGIAIAVS